jgi:hypothetical protein
MSCMCWCQRYDCEFFDMLEQETAKMNYMVNESLNASIEKTIIDARSRHSKKRGQFDHTVTLEQVATHKLENWRRMPREQRLTWVTESYVKLVPVYSQSFHHASDVRHCNFVM